MISTVPDAAVFFRALVARLLHSVSISHFDRMEVSMETLRGRNSLELDFNGLAERLVNYRHIQVDLGTGDGRYVQFLAERHHDSFIIGIDSCRENLIVRSRTKLRNMLFIIAGAQSLPHELNGLISDIAINFPWGSLLEGLLLDDPALMDGLSSLSQPAVHLDIRLNSEAMIEAGVTLEVGAGRIHDNLNRHGWKINTLVPMDAHALKRFPTTWAKRLAFGRDPRALVLSFFK